MQRSLSSLRIREGDNTIGIVTRETRTKGKRVEGGEDGGRESTRERKRTGGRGQGSDGRGEVGIGQGRGSDALIISRPPNPARARP